MPGLYRIELQDNQLRVLLNTAKLNLSPDQLSKLGLTMRDSAARVQARAVANVSGRPVRYDGRVFRVVPRTGALKGAIDMQWPYQSPLQARVFVDGNRMSMPEQIGGRAIKPRPVGEYAAAIEYGHGPIDLKKTMMGKTVPFFASRSANTTGPYNARGLVEVPGTAGKLWENKALNVKLTHPLFGRSTTTPKSPMYFRQQRTHAAYKGATGGAGTYYIAFRKVGKKGWIIPAAKPRPFMRAALHQSERDTRHIVAVGFRNLMADAHSAHI